MQENLSTKKYSFSNLEKFFKNKKLIELNLFYNEFIKNYKKLNKKYKFSEQIKEKYIYKQLKEIYFNKKKSYSNNLSFIPFGVKDNINTTNLDTKFGIKIRKKFRSGNDARVVSRIKEQGGVIFSKLKCAELAVHFIEKKYIQNPYNKNHIAGTSSTGSAVAVAVGAIPVALGTQTAGSILRPSSYCGVIGFKPSYGAIDRTGVLKTNDLADTVGIISNDFYGLNKTFKSLVSIHKDYPWTENYRKNFKTYKNKKNLKVGFFSDDLKIFKNFDLETKVNYEKTKETFIKNKFKLIKISNINYLNQFHKNFYKVYHKSLYYYLYNINPSFKNISKNLEEIIEDGKKITIKENSICLEFLIKAQKNFDKIINTVDFIIIPTTASCAPRLSEKEKEDSCLIWTTFGYPAINLPIYNSNINNLPFGLQIVSKKYNDLSLLDFSKNIFKNLK